MARGGWGGRDYIHQRLCRWGKSRASSGNLIKRREEEDVESITKLKKRFSRENVPAMRGVKRNSISH